jgi:hypothetical protein
MTFDPKAVERAAAAVAQLDACGARELLADLVRDVWATNVARFDVVAGDTVRVIAIQSAENIVKRLERLMRDSAVWKATKIQVGVTNNSMLITHGDLRIHFVKAPQTSRLHPDWNHDFAWDTSSHVRARSAYANHSAYKVPYREAIIDPMFSAEGLGDYGDPNNVNEFFVVWGGEISEQPVTAGWLVIPSIGHAPVLAAEQLWMDDRPTIGDSSSVDSTPTPDTQPEPHVEIQLKRNIGRTSNGV